MRKSPPTETLQTLRAARDLIARGWTQEFLAVDDFGRPAGPAWSPDACAWCSTGAVLAVSRSWYMRDYGHAIVALHDTIFDGEGVRENLCRDLEVWNDDRDRTQAEVLAAFDKAIATIERAVK